MTLPSHQFEGTVTGLEQNYYSSECRSIIFRSLILSTDIAMLGQARRDEGGEGGGGDASFSKDIQ